MSSALGLNGGTQAARMRGKIAPVGARVHRGWATAVCPQRPELKPAPPTSAPPRKPRYANVGGLPNRNALTAEPPCAHQASRLRPFPSLATVSAHSSCRRAAPAPCQRTRACNPCPGCQASSYTLAVPALARAPGKLSGRKQSSQACRLAPFFSFSCVITPSSKCHFSLQSLSTKSVFGSIMTIPPRKVDSAFARASTVSTSK